MTWLADSNLICESTKSQPSESACRWLEENDAEVVVDAIVLGEIWHGIVSLPDGRKRRDLETWFTRLRQSVSCLPWTDETSVVWGELCRDVRCRGFTVSVKDTMIAATAKRHGLTVATRNADDFTRCGVKVINPFA
jgi:toxin FitB